MTIAIRKSWLSIIAVVALAICGSAQNIGKPGDPIPDRTAYVGGTDGTSLRGLKTDSNGQLLVVLAAGGSTQAVNVAQFNGSVAVDAVHGLNSVGSGIPTAGMVGEFDDAATSACTENQFCFARLDQNRRILGAGTYGVSVLADNLTNNILVPYCGGSGGCQATGLNNGIGYVVGTLGFNGTGWDKSRTADLSNYNVTTTLTAVNSIGAGLVENGSRWTVNSAPAAGSQATASITNEASVRHVATAVCYSAGSTTAPVLTSKTIVLRDGATGAGTVLLTLNVTISAAPGNNIAPNCINIGNIVGTTNTAMTAEWDAGLANLSETVTLEGFNVQ
jgi:hypothetical protein